MEQEEKNLITIEDFKKLDLRIGTVTAAEKIPDADKLIRLLVDLGEQEPRQIIAGIAAFVPEPEELIGKQYVFVANMAPRMLRGLQSNGMLLAASSEEGPILLMPEKAAPSGAQVG